jgi:putative oxidoreductase
MGVGDPPSWEKAAMYVVMCGVLITAGGGPFSLDLAVVAPKVQAWLG